MLTDICGEGCLVLTEIQVEGLICVDRYLEGCLVLTDIWMVVLC